MAVAYQNSPSSLKTSPSFLRSCSGINFHSCDLQCTASFSVNAN